MEPFKQDELSDRELDGLLRSWQAPEPPAHLRAAVFSDAPRQRWRAFFGASVRIPIPAAVFAALVLALALWKWPRQVVYRESPPRVEVRTVQVEVPVVKKEVTTRVVYRDRSPGPTEQASELRPVSELKPRIIRGRNSDE